MKKQLKNILAISAIALTTFSCSKSSNDEVPLTPEPQSGSISLQYDNKYGGSDLVLDTQSNTTSQSENLKTTELKYIISNIVFVKADGSTYTYPKSKSYFVINERDIASQKITLPGVPFGEYVGVKFGLGVDQAQYDLGATGQGDFLSTAQREHMIWSWSAGYIFMKYEGTFTSSTVTTDTSYKVHVAKSGTDYNYKDITLTFPQRAVVSKSVTPNVGIVTDISKIIDGTNKISLTANNSGSGAEIMGGTNLPLIATNFVQMFTVSQVRN